MTHQSTQPVDAKIAAVPAIIDIAHLSQYTLGDLSLQKELLQLFRIQLKDQTAELLSCDTAKVWADACHMLKGASRAVGAWQISGVAESLETIAYEDETGRTAGLSRLLAANAAFEVAVVEHV